MGGGTGAWGPFLPIEDLVPPNDLDSHLALVNRGGEGGWANTNSAGCVKMLCRRDRVLLIGIDISISFLMKIGK